MTWPTDHWKANQDGLVYQTPNGKTRELFTIDCGDLLMPSGLLVVCDPFCFLRPSGNEYLQLEPGRYAVAVTLADVSGLQDRSRVLEAYASLFLDPSATEVRRQAMSLTEGGGEIFEDPENDFIGFGVDAGTACFIDELAVQRAMPDRDQMGR